MDEHLLRILKVAGKAPQILRLDNGSELLLLPRGGRVLGLFAGETTRNFYWTNPLLHDEAQARAFLGSSEWQNTGGDRTWLSPEIDFFFPKYPDLTIYHQPRQFDAQDYVVHEREGRTEMRTEFAIRHARQETPIHLRITKSVESVANPLRHEPIWNEIGEVIFAGYGLRTTLEFAAQPTPPIPVGLWHLIQMPHGGEMLIPTYGQARAKIVFGEVPDEDLGELAAGGIRYRMRAPGEQKISLRAVSCTGRTAYIYKADGEWHLVVRNFFVNPSGDYVDVPWSDPEDVGYAVQACNSNGKYGTFSELEYHIPAIGTPGGTTHCEDFAQVWAYRGARRQIERIARELLGVDA